MTKAFPLPSALPVEERSAEILARIRTVFAEKGFDGASMQDLARAAGMSVGNFYRYFPSKAAIVEAMVGFDMAEMEREFAAIAAADDPMAAMRATIADHVRMKKAEDGRLWSEITAAAQRKAEIADICCGMEDLVARNLLRILAHVSGFAVETAEERFGAHARFIIMMVKAAAMRPGGPPDPALEALILKSIDTVLTEIVTPSLPSRS